jgi:1,4-dihydroxy-2-naphthoate octaprenyltransferase
MERIDPSYRKLLRSAYPWALLVGVLFYALGAGIWVFLGRPIDWGIYLIGQVCVTALQVSSTLLYAYFNARPDEQEQLRVRRAREAGLEGEDVEFVPRAWLMLLAVTGLSIGAALTVLLYARGALNLTTLLFLGFAFLAALAYAVPPLKLGDSGYGELVQSVLVANLIPSLGLLLQSGEPHRLLAMLTFPLTALFLAMLLAFSLENYSLDFKRERASMLVRMGWQRGMVAHNVLILVAYFLIALAALLDMPWSLTWPALLSFPIGLFQIWQMWRISQGASPRWRLLRFTAAATVGVIGYLLVFALWVG